MMAFMRITLVLGADGAPFAHHLQSLLDQSDRLTVVAPVVRDQWVTGLKSCPDLDGLLRPDPARVGGPAHTYGVADRLIALGYSPGWQRPSDAALAARLIRSELLGAGYPLTGATAATATRSDVGFTLLPSSDDRAELHVVVTEDDGPRAIHVNDYLADPSTHVVQDVVLVAGAWSVSSAVRDELGTTDVLILGPSSRTLVIDPVLRTPGLLDLVADDLPVLVVEHEDDAPRALIMAAGLGEPDPGAVERVQADAAAVLNAARKVATS